MYDILVYISFFFIELLMCFLVKKYKSNIIVFIAFLFPLSFIGYRFNVGTDYKNYIRIFNDIKSVNSFSELMSINWEKGALILFKLVSFVTNDPRMLFIPCTFLTLFPIFYVNKMYNYKYLPLSMLIYNLIYLPFCLNVMRQGIAMSFTLLSFHFMLLKKDKKSIASFVFAFLFHKSCIILLPFFLAFRFDKSENKSKSTKKIIIISITISILMLFFGKTIMDSLGITFYNSYFDRMNIKGLDLSYFILYIPTIVLLIFIKTKDVFININRSLIVSGYFFGVVGTTAKYLNRLNVYFTIFEIILIPYLINRIKNKKTRVFVSILYVIYLVFYFVYQFYILGRHEIFPYNNWLFM